MNTKQRTQVTRSPQPYPPQRKRFIQNQHCSYSHPHHHRPVKLVPRLSFPLEETPLDQADKQASENTPHSRRKAHHHPITPSGRQLGEWWWWVILRCFNTNSQIRLKPPVSMTLLRSPPCSQMNHRWTYCRSRFSSTPCSWSHELGYDFMIVW